jgi:hypothetical protein
LIIPRAKPVRPPKLLHYSTFFGTEYRCDSSFINILHIVPKGNISVTGTRTRVAWVKARYPNHLDYYGGCQISSCNIISTLNFPLKMMETQALCEGCDRSQLPRRAFECPPISAKTRHRSGRVEWRIIETFRGPC